MANLFYDLVNKAPEMPKTSIQRLMEGEEEGKNIDGGPSGIPGYNRVLDPQGKEIGLMVLGGDPNSAEDMMSRTDAKREIAKTEGLHNVEEKDLDTVVQQVSERKPEPALERPDGFDYVGL